MMDKLISQQAAIDVVAKWIFEVFGIKESDGTATVFKRLRELPSAQPEQWWIPVTEESVIRAGYEGREVRFRIRGRLFAIRELAQ